jgi:hypothetical protein
VILQQVRRSHVNVPTHEDAYLVSKARKRQHPKSTDIKVNE